ncbi:MAG TPA: hypothetical protein VL325_08480 [Pyrinomonadaceae bacterium]|jgi:hypothetical protein|nr:hypothetical protein [Pyrinomonadaceae bacterium]
MQKKQDLARGKTHRSEAHGWHSSKMVAETVITKSGPYVAVVDAALEIRSIAQAGLAV